MFNPSIPVRLVAFFRAAATTVATSALLGVALTTSASAQSVYAYLSAPNKQAAPSIVANQTIETFDSGITTGNHTNYTSSIGTYTGTFNVVNNAVSPQYGAGTGNYFALGVQSGTAAPVTLTFATPLTYFGLSYNAGDNNNGLTFYDASGNNLGRYSTALLVAKLNGGAGTVTALDGSTYATTNYYGRPDGNSPNKTASGQDTGEAFAFLNFFPSSGTTISKVVFDNSNSTSNGFESDNHTISTDASNAPPTTGAFVAVGNSSAAAPEPGSIALLMVVGVPAVGLVRRRKSCLGKATATA